MRDNVKTEEETEGGYKGWAKSQLFVAAFNSQRDILKDV